MPATIEGICSNKISTGVLFYVSAKSNKERMKNKMVTAHWSLVTSECGCEV
jgi:hypothetical protein